LGGGSGIARLNTVEHIGQAIHFTGQVDAIGGRLGAWRGWARRGRARGGG
jgi:hypothetical protein